MIKEKINSMKTIVVNVPDRDENLFIALLQKLKFKTRVLTEEDREEMAMVKWIDEGMKSEDVSENKVFETLRKRGVKI